MDPITESGIMEDYQDFVEAANIKDAMMLDDFLNPVEEQLDIEEMEYAEECIIEAAETVEFDQVQENAEEEAMPLYADLSKKEEIKALAMTVAIYERRENTNAVNNVVEELRRLQKKIRWELAEEKKQKSTQLFITQFLGQ